MAKKKVVKKHVVKKKVSSDNLFVKHPNLQWLLPLLAGVVVITLILQKASY